MQLEEPRQLFETGLAEVEEELLLPEALANGDAGEVLAEGLTKT